MLANCCRHGRAAEHVEGLLGHRRRLERLARRHRRTQRLRSLIVYIIVITFFSNKIFKKWQEWYSVACGTTLRARCGACTASRGASSTARRTRTQNERDATVKTPQCEQLYLPLNNHDNYPTNKHPPSQQLYAFVHYFRPLPLACILSFEIYPANKIIE